MSDISHFYGSDLEVSSTGDLSIADTTTTGEQRLYRRLLTNPPLTDSAGDTLASGDYTFHPEYGAGVPRYVGQPEKVSEIKSLIKKQVALESAVATSPAPTITLTADGNQLSAVIAYNDAETKTPVIVSFDTSNP